MCLTTNDPVLKVATEDIVVYKIGHNQNETFEPKFRRFLYYLNEEAPAISIVAYSFDDKYIVDEGYHSYNNINDAIDARGYSQIAEFIIPKGAYYIDGWFSSTSTLNRVSSSIVFKSVIRNPEKTVEVVIEKKSWWKKLFNIK